MLPKLPVDISDFTQLRKGGYLYIDKTRFAFNLITGGKRFFLSRPRRFGKSLFVSTLDAILKGQKSLFKGLWIAKSSYALPVHGVIKLDFSLLKSRDAKTFEEHLSIALKKIAASYKLTLPTYDSANAKSPELLLQELAAALLDQFGYVAVLVDEYDAPILHTLKNARSAKGIRDSIGTFFTTLKGLTFINFVFVTGVSSFTKAGIFSGMNVLKTLSLNPDYAALLGYTEEEIKRHFKPYLAQWSDKAKTPQKRLSEQIKSWYNGYRFGTDAPTVYNPFSLTNAFDVQEFRNFWFNTGTPSFLIEELKKEQRQLECEIFDIENIQSSKDLLESFEVDEIPLSSLLFQTGYLTIDHYDTAADAYTLKCPNFEVRTSLHQHLLRLFGHLNASRAESITRELKSLLEREDIGGAVECLKGIFAHVPAQLHMDEEKFYHALIHVTCLAAGLQVQAERATSQGRIDLVLEFPHVLYLIEIKMKGSAQAALAQIRRQKYYEPFLSQKKPIRLVGLAIKRLTKAKDGKSRFELSYASHALKP